MRQPAGGIFWEHLASCLLPPSSTTDLKVPLLVDVFHFTDLLSVCQFVIGLFACQFVSFLFCYFVSLLVYQFVSLLVFWFFLLLCLFAFLFVWKTMVSVNQCFPLNIYDKVMSFQLFRPNCVFNNMHGMNKFSLKLTKVTKIRLIMMGKYRVGSVEAAGRSFFSFFGAK